MEPETAGPCDVWVDRGGTFTDVVVRAGSGDVRVTKHPSGSVSATVDAIRRLIGHETPGPIPHHVVRSVRCGTTVATNALLTRRGERSALLVTRGFADLLAIGTQDRPEIFALEIVRPAPLPERVIEVDERVLADGTVRTALDRGQVAASAQRLRDEGFDSVAVLFLHAFSHPAHELAAGDILRDAGVSHVALSHEVAREVKAVPRGQTATADAFLTPVLRRSLAQFRDAFAADVDVSFMQSHGGLADVQAARGPRAVLSGPAGGVVACGHIARSMREPRVVGFDMGGTSTDVCRYAGELEHVYETRVQGLELRVPSLRIETVAAGGGSVLTFDGRRLCVGPQSAGAEPGPAGYGRGGPATVTDANAVLGRILPERFPHCFGGDGASAFDPDLSRRALSPLCDAAQLGLEDGALGFLHVANACMADAIREVSLARGFDVREHALVCFGGAGAQHACALAASLDVRRVLLHPLGSVLSAWGIGHAEPAEERVRAVLTAWDAAGWRASRDAGRTLEAAARAELARQGYAAGRTVSETSVELRYVGTDATLTVPLGDDERSTTDAFERVHSRLYGFAPSEDPLEVVNVRVRALVPSAAPAAVGRETVKRDVPPEAAGSSSRVWFASASGAAVAMQVPVHELGALRPGDRVTAPSLCVDDITTVVVEPGWELVVHGSGVLVLRVTERARPRRHATERDPVSLALFGSAFMSIAERMGAVLERVSHSTNIKERLDFSCAVFDGHGRLVANAPHIPVHLGAMGESVRAIVAARGDDLLEGDVILTNDPYHGGSHLPDITAVTPVRVVAGRPAFFVANRAHHADVGGITPGSMPPLSRTIDDEGVRLHDVIAVRGGVFRDGDLRRLFAQGPHPSRAVEERLRDLRAQAAANATGAALIAELCDDTREDVVRAYMTHLLDDGEAALTELLERTPAGTYTAEDALDDGTPLRVRIDVDAGRARVDFAGTGPASAGNLNAPRAVTRAAVLYVLRCLVGREVPLNEGCLRPVEIVIPPDSILDPLPPRAVVGGNVETSMRIVDLLLRALGALGGSQGTMNNVTFGPPGGGAAYYETIAGGAGAGPGFHGASAVHSHMTNTRITDPEVLELRWPVVVRRFGIRRGSGGAGSFRGGEGAVREIEFLAAMEGGVLSEHRAAGALGAAGGGTGARGRNVLVTGAGEQELPGCAALRLGVGDVLRIETPGGGGFGRPGDS